jgi:cytochrome P450
VAFAQLSGKYHLFTQKAHEDYGTVVRISPNELSFISAAAWNHIYARHQGNPPLPRDKTFFNDMLVDKKTLTMADTENHARLRKAMNPAFSSRALASQEPILQQNVELFLEKLHDHATRGLQLDLRLWYNYITFDMIGDLAFGESFGCLDSSKFHAWVQFVVDYFYVATLLQVVHRFCPLNKLLAVLIPSSLMEQKEQHAGLTAEKVKRRMKRRTDRLDFVHPLIEARDSGAISTDEIEQQASILILAGGETTSIALTSATFLLLQNPDKMENLTKELQTHFQHESEIDVSSIKKLVYLQAVIQETLRMFPPITNGFPRQTIIGGVQIDGHVVPDQVGLNISTRLISIYADRYRLL